MAAIFILVSILYAILFDSALVEASVNYSSIFFGCTILETLRLVYQVTIQWKWPLVLLKTLNLIGNSCHIFGPDIKLVLGMVLHEFELSRRRHVLRIHHTGLPTARLTYLALSPIARDNFLLSIDCFVVEIILLVLRLFANDRNAFVG